MSWNKPSSAPQPPPKKSAPPSLKRGLLAGLLVVALVALGLYLFSSREATSPSLQKKDRGLIKEVTPAIPTKQVETNAVKKVDPNARPTKVGECVNGYVLLPSGRLHRRLGVVTNFNDSAAGKRPYEVFDFSCENEIACLLELPPGENLVGTPRYDGRFKAEFLDSLKQPIIIDENDSEYVKGVKKAVRETKVEMKAALDRGEDIEQIMLDARREAQTLAIYKMQLEREMDDVIRKGAQTEEDVSDCIRAVNQMLEAKGIAPMDVGLISKQKFRHMIRARERELKGKGMQKE